VHALTPEMIDVLVFLNKNFYLLNLTREELPAPQVVLFLLPKGYVIIEIIDNEEDMVG